MKDHNLTKLSCDYELWYEAQFLGGNISGSAKESLKQICVRMSLTEQQI